MKRAGIWLGLVAWASLIVAGCGGPDTSPKPSFVSVDNGSGKLSARQVTATRSAAGASVQNVPASALRSKDHRYFVEFRSRYALSYGHSFVIFGRVNGAGQVVEKQVAGLHPVSYAALPYIVGHVVPVPAETGASDGDLEDEYRSASWRVMLNKAQYDKAVVSIRKVQKSSPVWNGMTYNLSLIHI